MGAVLTALFAFFGVAGAGFAAGDGGQYCPPFFAFFGVAGAGFAAGHGGGVDRRFCVGDCLALKISY